MIANSVKFRGDLCFKEQWSGFDIIKPINVIIGRNNCGKSRLISFVESLCKQDKQRQFAKECLFTHQFTDESSLSFVRDMGSTWGGIGTQFSQMLTSQSFQWKVDQNRKVYDVELFSEFTAMFIEKIHRPDLREHFLKQLKEYLPKAQTPLTNRIFKRLLADRDIRLEPASNEMRLNEDGSLATNILRRFLLSADKTKFPSNLVRKDLLQALKTIFGDDASFTEISISEHDGIRDEGKVTQFEINLEERDKGLIPLSSSGSGLKTALLVLINLLVVPIIEGKSKNEYAFAFEELENNLHPALLRRLLRYIEEYALRENAIFFLTTHSNVALDMFGSLPHSQIVHVTHNGKTAQTQTVSGQLDKLSVISVLGAKPSDLLQSNGIIWVEGPSDRIYVNRWIELFSDGKWKEGRDYQCAFYGGSLLAHAQVAPDELAVEDMVNLFKVNPNIAVICDSDRTSRTGKGYNLRERTRRIKAELARIPGALCWITDPKEIEHYLPGAVIAKVFEKDKLPDPQPYKPFFPYAKKQSYLENTLKRKTMDKVELALKACPYMTKELMATRFDLADKMVKLIASIARWNSPDHRG